MLFAYPVEIHAHLREGLALDKTPYLQSMRMPSPQAVALDTAGLGANGWGTLVRSRVRGVLWGARTDRRADLPFRRPRSHIRNGRPGGACCILSSGSLQRRKCQLRMLFIMADNPNWNPHRTSG